MESGAPTSPTTSNVPAPTEDISTPRRRSPRVPAAAAAYLAAAAGGVVTADMTPTRRRSPRVEELANRPPTAAQLARIQMEERFTRRVSPRLGGSTDVASPRRPRTRAISEAIRAKHKRSSSPHEEKKTADGGAEGADDDIEGADDDGDVSYVPDGDESSSAQDGQEVDDAGRHVPAMHRIPLVEVSNEPVPAPPIKATHDGWESWLSYELQYSKETHQVLSVATTLSADGRNKKILNFVTPTPLFPEHLTPFERVYICTHGTKPKSTGTGQRPQRFIRFTGCPFKFTVKWEMDDDGIWRLNVKPRIMWHNHKIDAHVHKTYPVSRGVKDPETEQRGKQMVADGVSRTQVYNFFLERGENVYKVDVDNFINANRSRISNEDDNTATAIVLARLANEDRTSVITVDETDRHETGVISITTSHMRRMFSQFGQVLLVDCTHNSNRYKYQLCTFMVMDEHGQGQIVQQSLFETNADWNMERALDHLKRANPDCWHMVRVIIVDKDLNEIKHSGQETRVLEQEKPSPAQVKKRLAGIRVEHLDANNKKPSLSKDLNPTINRNAYYILPPTLLKACMGKFPIATRPGEAIGVDTESAEQRTRSTTQATGEECVGITRA